MRSSARSWPARGLGRGLDHAGQLGRASRAPRGLRDDRLDVVGGPEAVHAGPRRTSGSRRSPGRRPSCRAPCPPARADRSPPSGSGRTRSRAARAIMSSTSSRGERASTIRARPSPASRSSTAWPRSGCLLASTTTSRSRGLRPSVTSQPLEVDRIGDREDRTAHAAGPLDRTRHLRADADPDRLVREEAGAPQGVARVGVPDVLNQVDDGHGGLRPPRAIDLPPVDAGKEEHVWIDFVTRWDDVLGCGAPGIGRVPHRFLGEADLRLVARRGADVVEVVPDLQVAAGEPLEVSVEQDSGSLAT